MSDFDFIALDFETANNDRFSACQLAMIGVKANKVCETFNQYICPPDMFFGFTHVHGISYEHVKNENTFGELYPHIREFIGGTEYLIAHNMPFDRGVFIGCCDYYRLTIPEKQWCCTVQIGRQTWPKPAVVNNHKLNTLCQYFGIDLNHHEALSDTNAVVELIIQAQRDGWEPPWLNL
jgi:DNA polymerase-3 subunit epsilon